MKSPAEGEDLLVRWFQGLLVTHPHEVTENGRLTQCVNEILLAHKLHVVINSLSCQGVLSEYERLLLT